MDEKATKSVGRNEPCPCGSGRKYKRCCGVSAAPQLSTPKWAGESAAGEAGKAPQSPLGSQGSMMPGGFDPSQMDPQWMMQFTQTLQRLPRGQMQRLQALMQKAMAGKDISREAQEFERTLPPELHDLIKSANLPGMTGGAGVGAGMSAPALAAPEAEMNETETPDMSLEEAKAIVVQAAAAGKISESEASQLLESAAADPQASSEPRKSSFWKKLVTKK